MFAAQAGAKHVYAVDCSSIIEQAEKIAEKNGFGDKITMIKGKVEEIDLPVSMVDIIVSEWVCCNVVKLVLLYAQLLSPIPFALGFLYDVRRRWVIC